MLSLRCQSLVEIWKPILYVHFVLLLYGVQDSHQDTSFIHYIKIAKDSFSENILRHVHETLKVEKRTKTTKFQMSNQRLGVNQLLGVTPIADQQTFFFIFLHEPYMWASSTQDVKGTILMIFECFSSYSTMRTHAFAGRNSQQMFNRWHAYFSNFFAEMKKVLLISWQKVHCHFYFCFFRNHCCYLFFDDLTF